jgi:hypothetical protein
MAGCSGSHDAEMAKLNQGREGGYGAAIVKGREFAHLITYSLPDIGRTTICSTKRA